MSLWSRALSGLPQLIYRLGPMSAVFVFSSYLVCFLQPVIPLLVVCSSLTHSLSVMSFVWVLWIECLHYFPKANTFFLNWLWFKPTLTPISLKRMQHWTWLVHFLVGLVQRSLLHHIVPSNYSEVCISVFRVLDYLTMSD